MYTLHLEREVAISHQLNYHEGKCRNLHGHNLLIKVDIKADDIIKVDNYTEDGMIVDFGEIKRVIDRLDHKHMNDAFRGSPYELMLCNQPTAERIARYLALEIENICSNRFVTEIKVTVYEAQNQYVTYTLNLLGE